jgi:hypothetical protein
VRAKDFMADGHKYRTESPLTGDESRVAETSDVAFPQLLDPIDDLPPMTVVTRVVRRDGKLLASGVASDNGEIRRVVVNGVAAKSTGVNFSEWQADLPTSDTEIVAHAEDAAGNVEKLAHRSGRGRSATR